MKIRHLILSLLVTTGLFFTTGLHAQTGKSEALETLGSISGMLMYNTYATIGSIGDAYEEDVYEEDYVKSAMDEQVNGISSVLSHLSELKNSGFLTDSSDIAYIEKTIETFEYLSSQASALSAYAESLSSYDADRYQEYRDKAWTNISYLLGLE